MSPHWLFFPCTCWAVHFWARPVPGLSYSHAICWIGWSFWTAVLPLAQYGSAVALWMWGGLFQGNQIPLWVQHKRKLLIRVKHPVYRPTVYLFSDGATRIVWLYEIWLDITYNPFAGMLYSHGQCLFNGWPDEWDGHYVFHIGKCIWQCCCLWFLAACEFTMCIGALKVEGFTKWVTIGAKLSWNSHSKRSSHSRDVHPLPENSSPPSLS